MKKFSPLPASPVADLLRTAPQADQEAAARLSLTDLSLLPRWGCKGSQAGSWLSQNHVPIPTRPNSCGPAAAGWVLRLGQNEFVIEGDVALINKLRSMPRAPQVYPVVHQDACFLLRGHRLNEFLLQVCSINFMKLEDPVYSTLLTSMAGVSVVVHPMMKENPPFCRLWCDGSYGHYLWQTFYEIVESLGGGVIDAQALPASIFNPNT